MSKDEIVALRHALGLTQTQMAEKLGMHLRHLPAVGIRRRQPSAAAQKLLALTAAEVPRPTKKGKP